MVACEPGLPVLVRHLLRLLHHHWSWCHHLRLLHHLRLGHTVTAGHLRLTCHLRLSHHRLVLLAHHDGLLAWLLHLSSKHDWSAHANVHLTTLHHVWLLLSIVEWHWSRGHWLHRLSLIERNRCWSLRLSWCLLDLHLDLL